ncbi:MAG TPA: hypothetical protein GX498_00335 [Clostridiales bacterium]|nr:hypothetical protein [Clostridiales bacterium]
MANPFQSKNGSIIVLLLLLSSLIISFATILLSTAVMNTKMKNINKKSKNTYYVAENALEEAYAMIRDFVDLALEYARNSDNPKMAYIDFLYGNSYEQEKNQGLVAVLEDKSRYVICNMDNTSINAEMLNKLNYLQLNIKSCSTNGKIKREIVLVCHISIPEDEELYREVSSEDLVNIYDWKVER